LWALRARADSNALSAQTSVVWKEEDVEVEVE
jgi:hypothetical protein